MKDLTTLLKDADPVASDDALATADVQRIRRQMMAAVREAPGIFAAWQRPWAVAVVSCLVILIVGLSGVSDHLRGGDVKAPASAADAAVRGSSSSDRLQLQFSTPGGTRIIWIFDQNLRLQESMP
jgi:hypothetical protein